MTRRRGYDYGIDQNAVVGIFGFVLLLNIAWWGFVIFVTLKVLAHFGVL